MLYLCPLKALLNNLVTADRLLRPVARPPRRTVARRHQGVPAPADPHRSARHPADHARVARSHAHRGEDRSRASVGHVSARSWSTRCTPSPETTAAGICWPCWSGCERVTGRPIQRIGLSATVGNPRPAAHLAAGVRAREAPGQVVAPGLPSPAPRPRRPARCRRTVAAPAGDVELDYVGSLDNAAKLIAALHRGEKRLVFCDSRRQVEELGAALRARDVPSIPVPRLACRRRNGRGRSRRSRRHATASSSPPPPSNSASTSATWTESSRSTHRPPSPHSCSASAAPADVRHQPQLPVPGHPQRHPPSGGRAAVALGPRLGRACYAAIRATPSGGAAAPRPGPAGAQTR